MFCVYYGQNNKYIINFYFSNEYNAIFNSDDIINYLGISMKEYKRELRRFGIPMQHGFAYYFVDKTMAYKAVDYLNEKYKVLVKLLE